jgi:hypothetical protein
MEHHKGEIQKVWHNPYNIGVLGFNLGNCR